MKLNNAQDAIKQAIEGGMFDALDKEWEKEKENPLRYEPTLMSPVFWQALGKARGWEKETSICPLCESITIGASAAACYAHNWFETRLSNGDETNFWQSLP